MSEARDVNGIENGPVEQPLDDWLVGEDLNVADASFLQTSFLGGEWSPLVQGRMDDPLYKRA
jgi:hypothetical protein